MATMLQTLLPQTPQDVLHLVDDRLDTTIYLMRSTISMVLNASFGALGFSHDMIMNFPLIASVTIEKHW